jgi:hypothetical protein
MSTPLRELIALLAGDASTRAAFAADPVAFLGDHGWADLDGQDVGSALDALVHEAPLDQAVRLGEVVAATDPFDGGTDGALSGLEAVVAGAGEAPSADGGALTDPALVLDGPADGAADVDGAGDDGPDAFDLDGPDLDIDPAAGIDDATDVEHDLTSDDEVDDDEVPADLDDQPPLHQTLLGEPSLDDPLDGLAPAGEPDPWTMVGPGDDNVDAATDEPDVIDGT